VPASKDPDAVAAERCSAYKAGLGCTTFARCPQYGAMHCKCAAAATGLSEMSGALCYKFFDSGVAGLNPSAS